MRRWTWPTFADSTSYEKIVFAARIIAAIETPNDVCVVSARPYGHRAVLKFAASTGAQAMSVAQRPALEYADDAAPAASRPDPSPTTSPARSRSRVSSS